MPETVRLEIEVSPQANEDLRSFLGPDPAALSQFVEEVILTDAFQRSIEEIQQRNAGTHPDELQAIIDQAVWEVRQERAAQRS